MRIIRSAAVLIVVSSTLAACSFFDFFGYEENTGLALIERPEGYQSARFGSRLAATSTPDRDLLAIGAGSRFQTSVFLTAQNGDLVDISSPWDTFPGNPTVADLELSNTGADLAGLPVWGDSSVTGCVGIGEPVDNADIAGEFEPRVRVVCQAGSGLQTIVRPPEFGNSRDFGRHLAAVRPGVDGPWLLAVASADYAMVFSSRFEHSDLVEPESLERVEIVDIVAGRLDAGRFFLALGGSSANTGGVYLFEQEGENSKEIRQLGCLTRPGEPGFGGNLAVGDINGDGRDDLAVSASTRDDRLDAVHVYDIRQLIGAMADASNVAECVEDDGELSVTVTPTDGDLDVSCDGGCAFGTSLAIGDIATDNAGAELCIGAAYATVEGQRQAGAVYIYRQVQDGEQSFSLALAGQVIDSAPEETHWFGGGLVVAPMAGRNELVVGATGKGDVYIAFCTGVGQDLTEGADVTGDAHGAIISTRCRP